MSGLLGRNSLISHQLKPSVGWGDLQERGSSPRGRLISVSPWPSAPPVRCLVNTRGVDCSHLKCPWDELPKPQQPTVRLPGALNSFPVTAVTKRHRLGGLKQHAFIYSFPVLEVRNAEWSHWTTVEAWLAFPLQAPGGESASSPSWGSAGSSSVWALPQRDPAPVLVFEGQAPSTIEPDRGLLYLSANLSGHLFLPS